MSTLKISKNISRALSVITAIAVSLSLSACNNEDRVKKVIRPVRYVAAPLISESGDKTFSGVVQAEIKSGLSFKVYGTIIKLPVKIGDHVKKGQLIAALDPEQYQIKLQEANARYLESSAKAQNEELNFRRYKKLYVDEAISKSQFDDAKTDAQSTKNIMKADQKAFEYAKLQLSYTNLYAPMDGYIDSTDRELGENISPGRKIVGFISSARPEVKAYVPESFISSINKDTPVNIKINAIKDKVFKGKIIEVGVASNKDKTSYPVIAKVLNYTKDIKPGMSANLVFTSQTEAAPKIIIPISAVAEDRDGRYVYVAEPGEDGIGVVSRRKVEVGEIFLNGIEILTGITPGEKVITAGVNRIIDGQTVRLEG